MNFKFILLIHLIILIDTVFGINQAPPRIVKQPVSAVGRNLPTLGFHSVAIYPLTTCTDSDRSQFTHFFDLFLIGRNLPAIKQPPPGELLFQTDYDRPFIIECEAEGEPIPTYRWIKNGKDFHWQAYDDRIAVQPGRGTLVVNSPRDEDEGQYQCFAENTWGTATSNSVFLRKAELDSFKEAEPVIKDAREGEPLKLQCQPPNGWPKPNVYWLIQNSDGQFININDFRITRDPEGNLWFSNVTKQDESNDSVYACAATSHFRNEVRLGNKAILRVISTGSAPNQNKIPPIQQYVSRRKEVAIRGKRVQLYCIFGGTPLPQTIWRKNGHAFFTSDRISQENYGKSLEIRDITEEDEGEYTCEVSNGVGEPRSYSISLKVLAEPYFIEEPEIVDAAEDETAEVHCKASGNPEPQIYWIYNGKPISEAPPNPRRKVSTNSIIIENLQKSDTANYGCNATNSLGYVYKDIYVNVLAIAPDIVEPPSNEETVDGRTVVIKCGAVGSPKPKIKWIRNDVEITGGRYKTLKNGDLEITSVGFNDMGNYTCYAQNKISSANATASLVVKQRTQIKPGSGPVDFEVKSGDSATFKCSALKDESLDLTINWQKNGQTIDFESEPHFVLANDYSMRITKTTESDSGTYTCVASTRLDNAIAQATLIVQDIPNAPKLLKVECHSKDADIFWQPMGDNRAPILNYAIQYNTTFTPDTWNTAFDWVPSSDITYKVKMTPWANYTFRVLAKNKIGVSQPSSHSAVCRTDPDVPYKNPDNVMAKGTEPNNLVISWTPMPEIDHHASHFCYEVWWKRDIPGIRWESQSIPKWETREYIVHNTPRFEKYIVKVIAGNERGQARVPAIEVEGYSGEDVPTEAPRNLSLLSVLSATRANISWSGVSKESLRGHFKGYRIQMLSQCNQQVKEVIIYENITNAIIDKLTPNTKNFVRVLAFNGKYNSAPSDELSFYTPEGVPEAISSLEAFSLGTSGLYLVWKPPLETNGRLTGYKIYYQTVIGTESGLLRQRNPQITDPTQTRAKLAGLEAGTNYRIYIQATTRAGQGKKIFIEQRTRGTSTAPLIKPDFRYFLLSFDKPSATVKIVWLPCGGERYISYCNNQAIGSHFYVKYKLKGEPLYDTVTEINEDYVIIRGFRPNEVYEFIIGSVDGSYISESDPKETEIKPTYVPAVPGNCPHEIKLNH